MDCSSRALAGDVCDGFVHRFLHRFVRRPFPCETRTAQYTRLGDRIQGSHAQAGTRGATNGPLHFAQLLETLHMDLMDLMDLTNMKELIIWIMLLKQSEQSEHISR